MAKAAIKKTTKQDDDKMLMALINKYLTYRGMQKQELAIRIHMPESTFYTRCRNPGNFRRSELRKIFEVLHFSDEDKASIKW